jgi:GNAT superfamily N-acetyltransferase
MRVPLKLATDADAAAIASLRKAVADHLTELHGKGPWSSAGTEKGVRYDMRRSKVYVATSGADAVASLTLVTRKPWAIDVSHFTPCNRPLYLTSMAVHPEWQGRGIGTGCLEDARALARRWPADAIRLDAFDAPAGAGAFYATCGFREVGRASYRNTPLVYFELML